MINIFIQKRLSKIIYQINIYNRYAQHDLYQPFKNQYEKKLIIIFLYFSQIEIFKNIQTIIQSKNPVSIPIIVRSAIELVILMKIANQDINKLLSNYKHQLDVDIKELSLALNAKESKLTEDERIVVGSFLNSYLSSQIKLKDITKKKIYEFDKRKLSDISGELDQLYTTLSDHVHHGYDTLVLRHGVAKSNSYKASGSKKISKCFIYMCLHGALLCLLLSIIELFKCTGLPGNHNLKSIFSEIHDLDKIIIKKTSSYCKRLSD